MENESHDSKVHRRLITRQAIIDHVVNGLDFALLDAVELLESKKLPHEKKFEKKGNGSSFEIEIRLSFDLRSVG
jgi:hypothetical protein